MVFCEKIDLEVSGKKWVLNMSTARNLKLSGASALPDAKFIVRAAKRFTLKALTCDAFSITK